MDLHFHHNWPAAAERMAGFWRGESTDRPPIFLTVAKPENERVPLPKPESPDQKYFDPEFIAASCEARFSNSLFVAESLPAATQALMAGWLPTYGAPFIADDATVWIDKIIEDWDDAPDWEADWDDTGWQRLQGIIEELTTRAAGRYFVGVPPMLPPNDLLTMLRDSGDFLFDLIDHPEEIRHALRCMTTNYLRMWEAIIEITHREFEGYHHHYPVWSPEPLLSIQSDISCTMSPAMFEEFIIPELERLTNHTGRAIYHLDGPDAIKHLDRVLELPGLSMLQWVPGAGQPGGFEHWLHVFKRAQQKGKAILLPCGVGQLEAAVREFRPDLTYIASGEVATMDEAEMVLANLEKWTKQYWG